MVHSKLPKLVYKRAVVLSKLIVALAEKVAITPTDLNTFVTFVSDLNEVMAQLESLMDRNTELTHLF